MALIVESPIIKTLSQTDS